MKNFKKYWKIVKDNPKIVIGIVIALAIIISWVS